MIGSFKDVESEACFEGRPVQAGWQQVQRIAQRKLIALHAAVELKDVASPPGNRLEALADSRSGQHSIWINNQWRICFVWSENGPHSVEIVDYH